MGYFFTKCSQKCSPRENCCPYLSKKISIHYSRRLDAKGMTSRALQSVAESHCQKLKTVLSDVERRFPSNCPMWPRNIIERGRKIALIEFWVNFEVSYCPQHVLVVLSKSFQRACRSVCSRNSYRPPSIWPFPAFLRG